MRSNIENIKAFLIETLQRKSSINLFANYFSRMEENFAKYNLSNKIESFMHSYLTIYSNGEILHNEDIYPYLGLYHYNIVNGNYVTVSDELLDKTYNIEKLYFIINKYEINNPNVEKFYYTLDV